MAVNITKSVKITLAEREWIVKLERNYFNKQLGIQVMIYKDNEDGKYVMRHFLDFKEHPRNQVEGNIVKFIGVFDEKIAAEWVETYLRGKLKK